MKRRWWIAVAAVAALTVAMGAWLAWPAGSRDAGFDALKTADPHGALACDMARRWIRGDLRFDDGKAWDLGDVQTAAGRAAADSTTPAIKALVKINVGMVDLGLPSRYVHLEDLRAACAAAGVQMPTYTSPR